ncbi:MAG: hypothetical protein GXO30_01635 [Epsilonproteobacteria bacterium]|nr:hypothetical protein [Campylobacterota bacterium]
MKNVTQIINSLQHKPQYQKILQYKCIKRLTSALLQSIQKNIKYAYINNDKLYFVISATLNKYDKDNIINTIKMILNSPMILESDKFCECLDITIKDVIVYTDHKPKVDFNIYTTQTHNLKYHERATGQIQNEIKDEKLKSLVDSIQEIIKVKNETN